MSEDEAVAARSTPRVRVHLAARVQGADPDATYTATDLSASGAFLAGPPAAEGARLQVEIALPEVPLRCEATVRWVRSRRISPLMRQGMGVRFDPLPEIDQERLAAYIEEHVP